MSPNNPNAPAPSWRGFEFIKSMLGIKDEPKPKRTGVWYFVQADFGFGWETIFSDTSEHEVQFQLEEAQRNDPDYKYRIIKRRY